MGSYAIYVYGSYGLAALVTIVLMANRLRRSG